MVYLVRDKQGELKAKIPASTTAGLFNHTKGHFDQVQKPDESAPVTVWHVEEPVFCGDSTDGVRVYLWPGDVLIPEWEDPHDRGAT